MNLSIHKKFIALLMLLAPFLSAEVYAQKTDSNQVVCFVSQLKNPYAFLGMSGDSFELVDGSAWRVAGTTYSYTPNSSSGVLVCPDIKKMFISSTAISIEKSVKKTWQ